jgi:hypothetical protein
MGSLKDLKPLENAVTRITPFTALHVAVQITLDRVVERVNLLALKLAEAEAAAVTKVEEKKVEVENA